MIDTKDLRYRAECATQGKWRNGSDPCHFDAPEVTDDKTFAYYVPDMNNAAFIAAADPTTVLALLDDNERLRAAFNEQLPRVEWVTELYALQTQLARITEVVGRLKRGCTCDYDYRCGTCQAVIDLQELVAQRSS